MFVAVGFGVDTVVAVGGSGVAVAVFVGGTAVEVGASVGGNGVGVRVSNGSAVGSSSSEEHAAKPIPAISSNTVTTPATINRRPTRDTREVHSPNDFSTVVNR